MGYSRPLPNWKKYFFSLAKHSPTSSLTHFAGNHKISHKALSSKNPSTCTGNSWDWSFVVHAKRATEQATMMLFNHAKLLITRRFLPRLGMANFNIVDKTKHYRNSWQIIPCWDLTETETLQCSLLLQSDTWVADISDCQKLPN